MVSLRKKAYAHSWSRGWPSECSKTGGYSHNPCVPPIILDLPLGCLLQYLCWNDNTSVKHPLILCHVDLLVSALMVTSINLWLNAEQFSWMTSTYQRSELPDSVGTQRDCPPSHLSAGRLQGWKSPAHKELSKCPQLLFHTSPMLPRSLWDCSQMQLCQFICECAHSN